MDLLKNKTSQEILQSLLAEVAKSTNEIKCSQSDLNKAQSRLSFVLAAVNELLNRKDLKE